MLIFNRTKSFLVPAIFIVSFFLTFVVSTSTALANPNHQLPEELPEAIEHLQNKGLEILSNFKLGTSLEGWLVSFDGREQIIYTTADGDYLINGVVLDAQGNDLTHQHQKQWLSRLEFADLATSNFIANKPEQPKKHIYVFFDANCPFCQLAWLALQPYVEAGLEVRWLPVAYLQPSSKTKAASLLNMPPAEQNQLLAKLMQPQDHPDLTLNDYTENNLSQLEANAQLMQSLGLNATPAWVWQNDQGELESFTGMLRLPRIAEITGLPKQKHPEPSLMRFR